MIEQVRDAEPVALIVDDTFVDMGAELANSVQSIKALIITGKADASRCSVRSISYEDALQAMKPAPDAMRRDDDIACLFYTGGTTGRSKGVMLSHGNLWANAMATIAHLGLNDSLVHLHSGPLFHLGAGGSVYATAVAGGKHVVLARFTPEQACRRSPEKGHCRDLRPDDADDVARTAGLQTYDLSSLRMITYGASPMPEAVLPECLRRLPHVRFAQSYGMTELSPVATISAPRIIGWTPARTPALRRPAGVFGGGARRRCRRT